MEILLTAVISAGLTAILFTLAVAYATKKADKNRVRSQKTKPIMPKLASQLEPGDWMVDQSLRVVEDDKGNRDVVYVGDIPMSGKFKVEFKIGNEVIPIEEPVDFFDLQARS